jgi:hypothetical protein
VSFIGPRDRNLFKAAFDVEKAAVQEVVAHIRIGSDNISGVIDALRGGFDTARDSNG